MRKDWNIKIIGGIELEKPEKSMFCRNRCCHSPLFQATVVMVLTVVSTSDSSMQYEVYYKKYQTFFCRNLVDFNEAQFHEATLNLHTHAWIFSACQ